MKTRKKGLSTKEMKRRELQSQASSGVVSLYTPDGNVTATPKKHGYILSQEK